VRRRMYGFISPGSYLLADRSITRIDVLTPRDFLAQAGEA
jgi:hypothetical protein